MNVKAERYTEMPQQQVKKKAPVAGFPEKQAGLYTFWM